MAFYKIKSGRVVGDRGVLTYTGELGHLFYSQDDNVLRISDGHTPGGIPISSSGGSGGSFTVTNISYFTNDVGYLTSGTVNTYVTPTDRLTSGTSHLILTEDGTVTFPPGAALFQNTSSIVVNLVDAVLDSVVEYSTTSTDFIPAGTYGNDNIVYPPYAVFRLTVSPPVALFQGDIVAGPSVPVGTAITYAGTGTFVSDIITDADYSVLLGGILIVPPVPGVPLTFARPIVQQSFVITTPTNNSIGLIPGDGGTVIVHSDLIPLDQGTQNLGSALKRWAHLWLGAGTIYFKDETLQADIALTARDGFLKVLGAGGLDVGNFQFLNNVLTLKNPAQEFVIGNTTSTGYVNFNRPVKMTGISGNKVFEITRTGLVSVYPAQYIDTTQSAFSIVGNLEGIQQPRAFTGTMLQLTGQNGISTRVSIDSFGTGAYPNITGRAARGTVQAPTATKANDTLFRIAVQGYGDNQYVSSIGRISIEAAEDFTNATAGTRIALQVTPTGTNTIQTSTIFNSLGIDFDGNTTGGITFYDRTRQTTAFTGTVDSSIITNIGNIAVTSISIGTGLSGSGGPDAASINNEGVLSALGTPNQVSVNGSYTTSSNGNITLALPQDIAPTSNVTFNDITVNGQLNFLSTATILIPSTVEGTILYLGFTTTDVSQIDGGGIQLGNTATGIRSIFWNRAGNYWDFDGSGVRTKDFGATTATINNIIVTDGAHFGDSNIVGDYPTAAIQIDSNTNSYSQVVFQNHSSSTYASTDFVATNNIGDDSHHFIDMGINGSNYSTSSWTVNGANDGYLYVDSGNLALGTTATNIKFFTGGTLASNVRATITAQGLTVVSTVTSAGFYGPLTGAVTGDVTGNVSGNAGTVTNGVYSNQTYNNPVWLATLSGGKITGYVASATTVVNGVYTTDVGSVSNTMLAGGITNNKLSSSTITLNVSNGITVSQASPSLGGSTTIGFNTATLVATAVTATSAAYAYSFNTATLVANAVSAQSATTSTSAATAYSLANTSTTYVGRAVLADSATTSTSAAVAYSTVAAHTAGTGLSGSTFNGSTAVTWTLNTATLMANAVSATTSTSAATAYSLANTSTTYVGRAVLADSATTATNAAYAYSFNTGTLVANAVSATTATNAARATTATNLAAATGILAGTFTVSPNVAKNSLTTLTATITGLTTNHKIVITPQTVMPDNTTFFGAAYASASNTVSVQFSNGGGAVNATFTIGYFAWV